MKSCQDKKWITCFFKILPQKLEHFISFYKILSIHLFILVCLWWLCVLVLCAGRGHDCYGACLEVSEQLSWFSLSSPFPCVFWGLTQTARLACQLPLPTDPSHRSVFPSSMCSLITFCSYIIRTKSVFSHMLLELFFLVSITAIVLLTARAIL